MRMALSTALENGRAEASTHPHAHQAL